LIYSIIATFLIALIHIPELMDEEMGEKIAFFVLLAVAFLYSSAVAIDADIINFTEILELIITETFEYFGLNLM